eukprot:TRINITY_DN25608_c0_g1_i1.p1 TRINITY_DN25608_c0_g1~~TRINITY_DN25608_c0_g1_i1.p1  ORF type:complete len:131 (-),score=13.28 TRINITY_DN25608_c0_g1_i1:75-467(-)
MESNLSCSQLAANFGTLEAILLINIITLVIVTCLWGFVILYSLCLIMEKIKLRKVSIPFPPCPHPSVSSISGLNNVTPQTVGYTTITNKSVVSDSEATEHQENTEATHSYIDSCTANINEDAIIIENVTD